MGILWNLEPWYRTALDCVPGAWGWVLLLPGSVDACAVGVSFDSCALMARAGSDCVRHSSS